MRRFIAADPASVLVLGPTSPCQTFPQLKNASRGTSPQGSPPPPGSASCPSLPVVSLGAGSGR